MADNRNVSASGVRAATPPVHVGTGAEIASSQVTSILIDAALYPLSVVQRTAHRFSATHAVRVDRADGKWAVWLNARDGSFNSAGLEDDFYTWLVDDALRERIAEETCGIRLALVTAALAGTRAART